MVKLAFQHDARVRYALVPETAFPKECLPSLHPLFESSKTIGGSCSPGSWSPSYEYRVAAVPLSHQEIPAWLGDTGKVLDMPVCR